MCQRILENDLCFCEKRHTIKRVIDCMFYKMLDWVAATYVWEQKWQYKGLELLYSVNGVFAYLIVFRMSKCFLQFIARHFPHVYRFNASNKLLGSKIPSLPASWVVSITDICHYSLPVCSFFHNFPTCIICNYQCVLFASFDYHSWCYEFLLWLWQTRRFLGCWHKKECSKCTESINYSWHLLKILGVLFDQGTTLSIQKLWFAFEKQNLNDGWYSERLKLKKKEWRALNGIWRKDHIQQSG